MRVRFEPGVGNEISAIAKYLEGQRPGYGEKFLSDLRDALDAINRFPRMHETVHLDYRRALLERFHYHLFYREADADTILVGGIIHTPRSQEHWPQPQN